MCLNDEFPASLAELSQKRSAVLTPYPGTAVVFQPICQEANSA